MTKRVKMRPKLWEPLLCAAHPQELQQHPVWSFFQGYCGGREERQAVNSSQLKRTGYTGNSNFLFSVLAILLIPFFANNPSVWCDVRVRDCEAVQSQKQSKRRRQPTPIPTQFACLVRSPQNPLYCRYLSLESCDRQTKKNLQLPPHPRGSIIKHTKERLWRVRVWRD